MSKFIGRLHIPVKTIIIITTYSHVRMKEMADHLLVFEFPNERFVLKMTCVSVWISTNETHLLPSN